MPGNGRVIKVLPDVVVHTAGHALEELGHVGTPAASGAPGPGSVIQHGGGSELDELETVAHLSATTTQWLCQS